MARTAWLWAGPVEQVEPVGPVGPSVGLTSWHAQKRKTRKQVKDIYAYMNIQNANHNKAKQNRNPSRSKPNQMEQHKASGSCTCSSLILLQN